MRRATTLTALVAASVLLAGCGGTAAPGESTTPASASGANALEGELTVYAAASLKSAFDEIAAAFERENGAVDVLPIVYDGSSTLVTQLSEGASADVFASADEATMQLAVDAQLVGEPALFATNTLVVASPSANAGGIAELADLADPALNVVLCAPEVPCGAASARLLDAAGVALTPKSLEQSVTAVLTKVAEGVADAGLVYRTDVVGRDDLDSFVPEEAAGIVNRYPIAAIEDATEPEVAAAFVAFVQGSEGRAILAEYGFGAP